MANLVNYAQEWKTELLPIIMDGSYLSPFIVSNVEWLDHKTFNFTRMATSGYKPHSLLGGWNRGSVKQYNHPYTVEHDRDVEFFIDKREMDESKRTMTISNTNSVFTETQMTPEIDAQGFSRFASYAISAGLDDQFDVTTYTSDNVLVRLKGMIGKVRRYRNKGLVGYIAPEIVDALSLCKEFTRTIDVISLVDSASGKAVETRITSLDGVYLVEVLDQDRFYTEFDFTDEFVPGIGAFKINALFLTPQTSSIVPKIESIYVFNPGEHSQGDGGLYQNRAHWDSFNFPNGKDGAYDSIFCEYDTEAVV